MQHLNINIYGKVQGVYFRLNTKETADKIGLKGTVQNLADGSVYIEAEGESSTLKAFIEWCHHGPEMARVEKVEVKEGEIKDFSSFEIIRED